MNYPSLLFIACQLMIPLLCHAQSCVNTIAATAPAERFTTLPQGIVLDEKTQLMWMRCSYGQQWLNNRCTGKRVAIPWHDAQLAANTTEYAQFADWRLPTINELSSITELSCQSPAANLHWFPDTAARNYWTATEFINLDGYAWMVHFDFGENHTAKKSLAAHVRLVRHIQP